MPKVPWHAIPTAPRDTSDLQQARTARLIRRLFLSLLVVFLALGMLGLLGVRTSVASSQRNDHRLEVSYPSIARAGLAAPFSITVEGSPGRIEIANRTEYLAMFDENGLDPEPVDSWADKELTYWTFEIPVEGVLVVTFDARIEPAVQWARNGRTELLKGDQLLTQVSYTTWVMP